MKKIICKRLYDTDTAKCIQKFNSGTYGDPKGYEEILYQTLEGLYFLYVNGGTESPYQNEDILRLAKTKVKAWQETHQ